MNLRIEEDDEDLVRMCEHCHGEVIEGGLGSVCTNCGARECGSTYVTLEEWEELGNP